jgi:hypothetical protein
MVSLPHPCDFLFLYFITSVIPVSLPYYITFSQSLCLSVSLSQSPSVSQLIYHTALSHYPAVSLNLSHCLASALPHHLLNHCKSVSLQLYLAASLPHCLTSLPFYHTVLLSSCLFTTLSYYMHSRLQSHFIAIPYLTDEKSSCPDCFIYA